MSINEFSVDGSKYFVSPEASYELFIFKANSENEIATRTDHNGYHAAGGFSLKGDKVVYLTCDRHWYIPPVVKIWEYKQNKICSVESRHSPQHEHMAITYNHDLSSVILGGYDGSLSLCMPYENKVVWHLESTFDERTRITDLVLSVGEGLVWVHSELGARAYSLSDGTLLVKS
jgi:hypothetical protein